MPSTVNGIGTKYYGASDRQSDGSFVTTEWFVFCNVPLVPLSSKRVTYLGESQQGSQTTALYSIIEKVPLDRKLVLTAYAWVLIPLALGSCIFSTGLSSGSTSDTPATVCGVVLVAGMVFWVIVFPLMYKAK